MLLLLTIKSSRCHDPATEILSDSQFSNRVVRIADSVAVKFGHFITAEEFRNQQAAQQRLNADIVNAPKAYRAKIIAEKLGEVLNYIHRQEATSPGSLGGGPVSGALWPEHEEVEFSNSEDLQLWFDRHSPRRLGRKLSRPQEGSN
ncbi:hypothetical protein E2P81_ATG05758 [Venturia nashicola]|nr:hypothetical protein E2P81_ATG05758 [Venturia nashicola]